MANRCNQTIHLYGNPEKVKEVIDYLISNKVNPRARKNFVIDIFPMSLCTISENKIFVNRNNEPETLHSISYKFPDVGFMSQSSTDGIGQEEKTFYLNSNIIYHTYYEVEAAELWEKTTGNKMLNTKFI